MCTKGKPNPIYEMWKSGTLTREFLYTKVLDRVKGKLGERTVESYLPPGVEMREWALGGSSFLSILLSDDFHPKDLDIICAVTCKRSVIHDIFKSLQSVPHIVDGLEVTYAYYNGNRSKPCIMIRAVADILVDHEMKHFSAKVADIILTTDSIKDCVKAFDYHMCMSYCSEKECVIADPELTFNYISYGSGHSDYRRRKYASRGFTLVDDNYRICTDCGDKVMKGFKDLYDGLGRSIETLIQLRLISSIRKLEYLGEWMSAPMVDLNEIIASEVVSCALCDPRRASNGIVTPNLITIA